MSYKSEDEIAADLRVIISRLVKIIRKEVPNEEFLSLTERSTLSLVYQNGEILPSELATMEKVTNQAMSQIINKLLKNSFIKKTTSKKDKRKVIISIAADGRHYVERKRHEKQEWMAKYIHEKLTLKEKGILIEAIKVLTKLTEAE